MGASSDFVGGIAAQVGDTLGDAEREGARIHAAAERDASRAGSEPVAALAQQLNERTERLRELRTQLNERGRIAETRLRDLAAQLAEIPGRLGRPEDVTTTRGEGGR